jgi:AraC-like DNA-binding protein
MDTCVYAQRKTSQGNYKAALWHLSGFHHLEMLSASYSNHSFPRHWHETYVIQVVEQGINEFICEGQTWTAPKGSIVIINPSEVHTGHSIGNDTLKYRSFYPSAELFSDVLSQLNHPARRDVFFPSCVVTDPGLAGLILRAHNKAESEDLSVEAHSLLLWAMSELAMKCSDQQFVLKPVKTENVSILRARDYIQDHFSDNITLNQLADVSGLSSFHFLRMFQKAFGLPPHEFVRNVRIERARALLKKGHPIAVVAGETGFYDQSHFNRHFKRIMGLTPGQYRLL